MRLRRHVRRRRRRRPSSPSVRGKHEEGRSGWDWVPPSQKPTLSRPTHQSSGKDDGPISSLPDGHSNAQSDHINSGLHSTNRVGKYISLDCEMVGTGLPPHTDNVLARVSVVNFHGEQLYDSYVLPSPGLIVEDYRTFVSGIQPHHLKPGYARPFVEVQTDVAHLLHARILVGHALRNDLDVLMLSHPKRDVRDYCPVSQVPEAAPRHPGAEAFGERGAGAGDSGGRAFESWRMPGRQCSCLGRRKLGLKRRLGESLEREEFRGKRESRRRVEAEFMGAHLMMMWMRVTTWMCWMAKRTWMTSRTLMQKRRKISRLRLGQGRRRAKKKKRTKRK